MIEQTDAELKILITKLEEASNKIEVLLTIPDKEIRDETIDETLNQIGTLCESCEFARIKIDSFHMSNPENEQKVFEDFLAIRDIEKEVIVKIMDLIVKIGIIDEESDLEKRKTWLQKIKKA